MGVCGGAVDDVDVFDGVGSVGAPLAKLIFPFFVGAPVTGGAKT